MLVNRHNAVLVNRHNFVLVIHHSFVIVYKHNFMLVSQFPQVHKANDTYVLTGRQYYTCNDYYSQSDRFYSVGRVSSGSATLPKLTQSCTAAHKSTQ